jgi:SAM-dependent methyltransferase/uncharacterized protein YbaR (Trm112 family)
MHEALLQYLRCPVTRLPLQLTIISKAEKEYLNEKISFISEGILTCNEWCYPVINGIPRLLIEAFIDYEDFLGKNLPDFDSRKEKIYANYDGLVKYVVKKNKRTKASFEQEWNEFDYENDTTWNANPTEMLDRFLKETDETKESIGNKLIFDAGCGNGLLDKLIADIDCKVLAMDFSLSIERAFAKNNNPNVWFIQGDVQFPPVPFNCFDIVQCSGVLICTDNAETSFSCLSPTVKSGGKLSVWLYHSRKDWLHNFFNWLRKYTSKLPLKLQYYLYLIFLLPPVSAIKKLKENKQNKRELMIDLLDWLSPEFRWEISHSVAKGWYSKRNFSNVKITTMEMFGFNIVGTLQTE